MRRTARFPSALLRSPSAILRSPSAILRSPAARSLRVPLGVAALSLLLAACPDQAPDEAPALPKVPDATISSLADGSREDVDACRREAKVMGGGSEGVVRLTWLVDAGGQVDGLQVAESTAEGDHLADCLSGIVRRWSFEPRPETAEAAWTFRLTTPLRRPVDTDDDAGEGAAAAALARAAAPRLDRAAVAEVVEARAVDLNACAAAAAERGAPAAGKLAVFWAIDGSGAVPSANVNPTATTVRDPEMVACALRAIRTWRFPAQAGRLPTQIDWAWDFAAPPSEPQPSEAEAGTAAGEAAP